MTHPYTLAYREEAAVAEKLAALAEQWGANPYAIHKRPPFRAHSFDGDDRFWVVGSTGVSVFWGAFGPMAWAERIADTLNQSSERI